MSLRRRHARRYPPPWTESHPSLLGEGTQTNVEAAYGLARLWPHYDGPLVRIWRDLDSAETDIYALDDGALDWQSVLDWISGSAGNARAAMWYDQTGNGRHLEAQDIAHEGAPFLTLSKDVEKPVLEIDSDNWMQATAHWWPPPKEAVNRAVITAITRTAGSPCAVIDTAAPAAPASSNGWAMYDYGGDPQSIQYASVSDWGPPPTPMSGVTPLVSTEFGTDVPRVIYTVVRPDHSADMYSKDVYTPDSYSSDAGAARWDFLRVGKSYDGTVSMTGTMYLLLVYRGEPTTEWRVSVMGSIGNYYGIYVGL